MAESPTLRDEHRLSVIGNWVLREIFGSMRDGVTVELRQLHNEERHNLCIKYTVMCQSNTTNFCFFFLLY